jgi:hypothetical protein
MNFSHDTSTFSILWPYVPNSLYHETLNVRDSKCACQANNPALIALSSVGRIHHVLQQREALPVMQQGIADVQTVLGTRCKARLIPRGAGVPLVAFSLVLS